MDHLQTTHFLQLPRPDSFNGPPAGVVDTTTVAAHDFDVDTRTGFMPPQQPLRRLPPEWETWESVLDSAMAPRLHLGCKTGLTNAEMLRSEAWRATVRKLPTLSTANLMDSEVQLRRAHHVLAWIMHFYIHSLPPSCPIRIPPPITVPLLQVSAQLQLPPILTYSDDVLYNWKFKDGKETDGDGNSVIPTIANIDTQTLFTGTKDEAEFFLTSARIELKGVEALDLMQNMMDEAFVGDDIATRRITTYLTDLAGVIKELTDMLMQVKDKCSPDVFYNEIRPWFRGEDSMPGKWEFEGMEVDGGLCPPTELSGASAGQSSLIHALDIFLGVDQFSHSPDGKMGEGSIAPSSSSSSSQPSSTTPPSHQQPHSAFLKRMQLYMPRHHRAFLNHLTNNPRPLRNIVTSQSAHPSQASAQLLEAYNAAVRALKEFRDKHMIIVALYIVVPGRKGGESGVGGVRGVGGGSGGGGRVSLKGTGGTDLVRFLKEVRDQTRSALLT